MLHWDQKHLTGDSDENKKSKRQKKYAIKRKLKFEDYKHSVETTHLRNKKKLLENNKLNVDNHWECHEEFIKKQ